MTFVSVKDNFFFINQQMKIAFFMFSLSAKAKIYYFSDDRILFSFFNNYTFTVFSYFCIAKRYCLTRIKTKKPHPQANNEKP